MLKTILTPFFLLLGLVLTAQERHTPAVVDTDSGTLTGFVRYPASPGTPQHFTFSETAGGPFRDLGAARPRRVLLGDGTLFERHRVRVPVLPLAVSERRPESYSDATYLDAPVVVQRLLTGSLSLFQFRDSFGGAHFFVSRGADTLSWLPYQPYADEQGRIQGAVAYRNALFRLATAGGCGAAIESEIVNLPYEAKELLALVQRINSCTSDAGIVHGRQSRVQAYLGPLVSAGTFSYRATEGGADVDPVGGKADGSAIGAGVFFELQARRPDPAFIIGFGFFYRPVRYTFEYVFPPSPLYQGVARIRENVRSGLFIAEPTARYLFGSGALRPFAEGGASLRLGQRREAIRTYYNSLGGVSGIFNGKTQDPSVGINALGGAGLQHRRGSLHLRYSAALQSTSYSFLSTVLQVRIN
ncbi:MAG: hypothetical protein EOO16_04055 [Chitinophagaceae bacterium]|nr:MAG: hypothetical protein EOO16_04055 [Chitinophagaceae bacterium]